MLQKMCGDFFTDRGRF